MPIEGKVAEILDKYTLVANIGEEDNVEEGMKFEVYEEGPMITDPETGEELGKPETVKIRVVADEVMENMSLMTTETKTYKYNTLASFSRSIDNPFVETERVQKKIKTDKYLSDNRKKLEVGDSLREVTDDQDGEET